MSKVMFMKKIELKPIIIVICLIMFQGLCYLISKQLEGTPHLIGSLIDQKIPFSIYAIIPYCTWYFMLFIVPYIIYKKDKTKFSKYCITYILMTIVANIIFVIYPTTVNRPIVEGASIIELLTRLIFWIDTPVLNCFPSLHCAISMLWILFIFNIKESTNKEKMIITTISILIMLSTLYLKQHVFIDLVSGDIIATCIYFIIIKDNKLTNKFKKLLKI